MLKRTVDIVLAGVLLVAALPVLVVASVLIKIESGAPVLFSQTRLGRSFRPFRILKLRTMRPANQGLRFTVNGDPRITRVGRWLRWLKVDELPQLWNVLIGDMSLVGPRPVVPELAIEFREAYKALLAVRPGLTDPATLKYCREDELLAFIPDQRHHYTTVMVPDKLRISAEYIRRASLWTDLCLMVETALALVPAQWRMWARRPFRLCGGLPLGKSAQRAAARAPEQV